MCLLRCHCGARVTPWYSQHTTEKRERPQRWEDVHLFEINKHEEKTQPSWKSKKNGKAKRASITRQQKKTSTHTLNLVTCHPICRRKRMRLWIVRFASVDLHPQGLIDIDVTQRQGTFRAMLTFDQRPEFAHPLLRYSTLLAFFAILPCPDQPPSVPLAQLQPCCKLLSTFGCIGTMLHTTPPNPHPSMAVHIFLWESCLC